MNEASSAQKPGHVTALMPMRHNSERVIGKNYRPFADGTPLFVHMVRALKACPRVDRIVIDTDSPNVREICAADHPDVILLERPEHLRDGAIPMNDILRHDLSQVDGTFFLQTHSTNPVLRPETLSQAIETFFDQYPIYDSLFSVTRHQTRLWDQLARAINHNPEILLRTQDLPPVYEENSCFYIFSRETLEVQNKRIGARPFMFEVDKLEAQDIDEEVDFRIAEAVFREVRQDAS